MERRWRCSSFVGSRKLGSGRGSLGGAKVAAAAGAEAVGGVAEVLDEGGHAALRGLSEGGHAVDLLAAEVELGVVAGAPPGVAGRADVAFDVERRGVLRGELGEGVGDDVGIHAQAAGEVCGGLEVWGEGGEDAGELRGGGVVALKEEVVHLPVGERVEEDAAGREAVATGAADLLVEAFDRGGEGSVDDGADVGLVDAHAKGDGGDDGVELPGEEGRLDAVAGAGVEAGVVSGGAATEAAGELFGGFARGGVDDRGAGAGGLEEVDDELVAAGLRELDGLDGEVVAAEAVDEEGGVSEAELGDDVVLDGGGGGGGEGDDGGRAEGRKMFA